MAGNPRNDTSKPANTEASEKASPEVSASGDAVFPPGEPPVITSADTASGELGEVSVPMDSNFAITAFGDGSGIVSASYEGILPPPNLLKGYNDIEPGAAKQIISWVTEETKHRRQQEKGESEHRRRLETKAMDLGEKALDAGIKRAYIGMGLAWPLMIGVVVSGSLLVYTGHDTAGTTIVTSGLGLIAAAYITQQIRNWPKGNNKKRSKSEMTGDDEQDD